MRIAVGTCWQETNTFNPQVTRWSDFEAMGIAMGDDVVGRYGNTGELSGFLAEFRQLRPDAEYPGLARFGCWPSGSIEASAWQRIKETFAAQLRAVGTVDGVYLALHGALCSEDEPDVTGALLKLTREIVGPNVPIVGSLDLHAIITLKMMQNADVLSGYHTSPHVDGPQTAARAARALNWLLTSKQRPTTLVRKLPMITAAESHNTFVGPPAPLYRRLEELERHPDVLSAGLYMAMPWYDQPQLGWTYTLTTKSGSSEWKAVIDDLAQSAWNLRHVMEDIERFAPDKVVARALSVSGKPVVIGDGADATNSGSTGDSTVLIAEFLKQPIPGGALTFLIDREAVAAAYSAGVGNAYDFEIGGKLAGYSKPVRFQGRVEKLQDVKWILSGHISTNLPIDMGRGAVVRSGDVTILLCERSGPGSSPKLFESVGLDPRDFKIVVAKSPAGFRADYGPFAADILLADCPGPAAAHWSSLKFERANRPLFPLDEVASPDVEWCRAGSMG